MIRVCGITFAHSPNYGSCLQAFALKNAVESLKICGEDCSYQVIPIQMMKDYPVDGLRGRIANLLLAWNRMQYKSFYRKYMKYVACSSMRELPSLNNQFDAFVCGSDVIWNDSFNRHVGAYYLDFAEKYRFSYAASFGKADVSDEYIQFAREKIDRLNAISVREPSAVQIAKKCTEKDVTVVADPVLLVDRGTWKQIAAADVSKDPYIFVYATHLNKTIKQYLEKVKEVTRLRVVWAVAGPKQALKQGMLRVQTPEEWLGFLQNAEYIVTNSFHATAFSVLFHKKFFTVVNGNKAKGINVRMNDFLTTLGLENRIFSATPEKIDLTEIDFTDADKKIETMKTNSLAFIRRNLEAAYQQKKESEQSSC